MRWPMCGHVWRRRRCGSVLVHEEAGGFWVRFGRATTAPGVLVRWRERPTDYVPFSERSGHVRMRRLGPVSARWLRGRAF